jgi:hypothetical protein
LQQDLWPELKLLQLDPDLQPDLEWIHDRIRIFDQIRNRISDQIRIATRFVARSGTGFATGRDGRFLNGKKVCDHVSRPILLLQSLISPPYCDSVPLMCTWIHPQNNKHHFSHCQLSSQLAIFSKYNIFWRTQKDLNFLRFFWLWYLNNGFKNIYFLVSWT